MLSVRGPTMGMVTGVRWSSGRMAEEEGSQESPGPVPEGYTTCGHPMRGVTVSKPWKLRFRLRGRPDLGEGFSAKAVSGPVNVPLSL